MDIKRKERGTYPIVQARFLPVMCNHCERAAWPRPGPDLEPSRLDCLRGPGHGTGPAGVVGTYTGSARYEPVGS